MSNSTKIKKASDLSAMPTVGKRQADYKNKDTNECWYYSAPVKEHFFNPRNFLKEEPKDGEFDAEGEIGNFKCGDIFHMWIKIDKDGKKIEKLAWKTFGCGPAIASASMFSEMVLERGGLTIEKALKITPQDIIKRLGGVPSRKMHCSVMAHQAFRKAVENY